MTDENAAPHSREEVNHPEDQKWELRLYVSGSTLKSLRAISNLERICQHRLAGQYRITVVNLDEHPELAKSDDIFALPTLVRTLPLPIRKIVGDLSNTEMVLFGLDILVDE